MDKSPVGPKRSLRTDASGTLGYLAVALCLALVAATAWWHFHNRKWLGPTFNADVEFTVAPDSTRPGVASRFVVHVAQDNKDTPLPGRVMDVTVTPADKAQIISISGASGTNYAKESFRAKGRTDRQGNLDIVLRTREPGKYTVVATDSASLKEGTVNFWVREPNG